MRRSLANSRQSRGKPILVTKPNSSKLAPQERLKSRESTWPCLISLIMRWFRTIACGQRMALRRSLEERSDFSSTALEFYWILCSCPCCLSKLLDMTISNWHSVEVWHRQSALWFGHSEGVWQGGMATEVQGLLPSCVSQKSLHLARNTNSKRLRHPSPLVYPANKVKLDMIASATQWAIAGAFTVSRCGSRT